MVEYLKKSVEDLEPPVCQSCDVEMTWYHSQRPLTEPEMISHYFHCPNCNRVKEVKTKPSQADGKKTPPRLSLPWRQSRDPVAA